MERCIRCKRTEDEVELLDGIYINETVKVCERCSLLGNIPVLKSPTIEQLKKSERTESIRARVMRLSGIKPEERKKITLAEEMNRLKENPAIEKINQRPVMLVDNFHWIVLYMRRRKKITAKQLGEAIGENEMAIKMIEQNKLPGNYLSLIKKIEQYFGVRLIKPDPRELIIKENELIKKKEELKQKEIQLEELENIRKKKEKEILKKEMIEQAKTKGIDESFIGNVPLAELMKRNEKIEKDFPHKTKDEVGKEQLADFGKQESPKIKSLRTVNTLEKNEIKGKTPTIYELVKKKEEKDKAFVGNGIEVIEDDKN
jgi:ribosome-binding protein aMBF1 (putative translation factor)